MAAGTTCATVLTQAIFAEGCKSVAAGVNVMDLRAGITMAVDAVIANLKSRALMISTSEEIMQVSAPVIIEVENYIQEIKFEASRYFYICSRTRIDTSCRKCRLLLVGFLYDRCLYFYEFFINIGNQGWVESM